MSIVFRCKRVQLRIEGVREAGGAERMIFKISVLLLLRA